MCGFTCFYNLAIARSWQNIKNDRTPGAPPLPSTRPISARRPCSVPQVGSGHSVSMNHSGHRMYAITYVDASMHTCVLQVSAVLIE